MSALSTHSKFMKPVRRSLWRAFFAVSTLFALAGSSRAADFFREGFENGLGSWTVEGGLWAAGAPKAANGPAPFVGASIAGTGLTNNYGATHNARLISPEFVFPPGTETPRLTY